MVLDTITKKENVSPTKILTDRELSIIFEHLTQHNQVDSIESIYADVYHEPAKQQAAPAAKAEQAKPARKDGKAASAAQDKNASSPAAQDKGAPAAQGQKDQAKAAPSRPASRTPEKKVVDTRKGGGVNLEKYDQRLEDLAPD